jgi:small-conductance mechanosensitive channel
MTEETANKTRPGRLLLIAIILGMCGGVLVFAQNPSPPASSQPISGSQVIQFLNQTIKWYRHLSAEQRIASEPDDQMVVYNNRQVADQVVRLSFDFARAEADVLAKQASSNSSQNSDGSPERYQALRAMQEKLNKTVKDTQAELDSNRQKLATATGRRRQEFASQVSELQAELDLATARREAVRSMVEFVSGTNSNGLGATGLRAQIEALAASIPAAASNSPAGRQSAGSSQATIPAAGANVTYSGPDVTGIWDLVDDIFVQSARIRTIESLIARTDALSKSAKDLRAPLTSPLRELFRKSDELAAQADSASPAELDQEKKQLDGLATQFKQITSASMPLSKQSVLLALYQRSLSNWREATDGRRMADWRNLGVRLGFLALILGIVFISAEVWRRAVYRYVQEPRQRYQFLLLRRFVLWLVIALIFAFTLAGRLSSIVTFAGLLTAGVAVALQSVILSVVGYFFLIGKFGIRVGDRVQIGSVTGEVIEIGLVRLHLMELGSGGFGAPTGRVVAFSNSIVFQPSSGLFKQISGTNFNWHEVRLALARTADLGLTKEKLLKAVAGVLADYSTELELQYREMRRTVQSVPADGLNPKIQLRILPASVEAVIRFPVSFRNESEIDERVSQALLKAVEDDPSLRAPGADSPAVHLRSDLSTADAAG